MTVSEIAEEAARIVLAKLGGVHIAPEPTQPSMGDTPFRQVSASFSTPDEWQGAAERLADAICSDIGSGPARFFILKLPVLMKAEIANVGGLSLRYISDFYSVMDDAYVSRFDVAWGKL